MAVYEKKKVDTSLRGGLPLGRRISQEHPGIAGIAGRFFAEVASKIKISSRTGQR